MQLRGVVKCPKCGKVYHRALYDFDYISCTERGCGQDFIKCTGQPWPRNSEPVELAATDSQQLKAAILLVRERAEELFLEPGQFDTLEKYLDLLAKRAAV